MGSNKKNKKKRPASQKLVINFDWEARKEYLTGMSKRKKQRREKAIQDLKNRAKAERQQALKEQREAFQSMSRSKKEEESEEEVDSEEQEQKGSEEALVEMSESKAKSKTFTKEVKDEFSQNAFGNSSVKITTTTLESSDEELEVEEHKNSWGKFSGRKNVKTPLGKAGKTLQKLAAIKDKKNNKRKNKKGKGAGGSFRTKKAGAKERRRRK